MIFLKTTLVACLLLPFATGVAHAQTSDMSINVTGYKVATNGAEKSSGVSRSVRLSPSAMGKNVPTLIRTLGCGDFSVAASPDDRTENLKATWHDNEGTIAYWFLDITPVRVVDKAVTFRLRWSRNVPAGISANGPAKEDVEVTLLPGESRPIDTLVVPASRPSDKPSCGVKAASLRVSVDYNRFDRELVGLDVWLVERLANGKEDSQRQAVRAVPYRAVPFYFDSLTTGADRYDFSGELMVEIKDGMIEIEIEAIRARADKGQSGYQAARWFRSRIQVKPGETVEVALNSRDTDKDLADRQISLRIQAKQIR